MLLTEPWAKAPMKERCPSCGSDIHRVAFKEHKGYHVPEGITYWQYCHHCTWMGSPTLYEIKRA